MLAYFPGFQLIITVELLTFSVGVFSSPNGISTALSRSCSRLSFRGFPGRPMSSLVPSVEFVVT